jgi:DNA replication and repair protein RecF
VISALRLTRLSLSNFRNYQSEAVSLSRRVVVISGENGAGKTNLLEAISILSPGRGLRRAKAADLARSGTAGALPWAVNGRFDSEAGAFSVGIGASVHGRAEKRSLQFNGAPMRTRADLADHVAMVWVTPQMDSLFQGAAGERRRFLDRMVWALEPNHARELNAYETAMKQRNRLLQGGPRDDAWLAALENQMACHGVALAAMRNDVVDKLNGMLERHSIQKFPSARIELVCSLGTALKVGSALETEERWRRQWHVARSRDAAASATLAGPHRCEMRVWHVEKAVSAEAASTGEQKALLISLVLAHTALIQVVRGAAPILLFDEIAAHFDAERLAALFSTLSKLEAQCFLTGAEERAFAPLRPVAEWLRVRDGAVVNAGSFPLP